MTSAHVLHSATVVAETTTRPHVLFLYTGLVVVFVGIVGWCVGASSKNRTWSRVGAGACIVVGCALIVIGRSDTVSSHEAEAAEHRTQSWRMPRGSVVEALHRQGVVLVDPSPPEPHPINELLVADEEKESKRDYTLIDRGVGSSPPFSTAIRPNRTYDVFALDAKGRAQACVIKIGHPTWRGIDIATDCPQPDADPVVIDSETLEPSGMTIDSDEIEHGKWHTVDERGRRHTCQVSPSSVGDVLMCSEGTQIGDSADLRLVGAGR